MTVMRGAFHVPELYRNAVANKHIVIIDDVMTTGASSAAVAQSLKRAGMKRVSAVVAACVC